MPYHSTESLELRIFRGCFSIVTLLLQCSSMRKVNWNAQIHTNSLWMYFHSMSNRCKLQYIFSRTHVTDTVAGSTHTEIPPEDDSATTIGIFYNALVFYLKVHTAHYKICFAMSTHVRFLNIIVIFANFWTACRVNKKIFVLQDVTDMHIYIFDKMTGKLH